MAEVIHADGATVIVKDWERILSQYNAEMLRVDPVGDVFLFLGKEWKNISECEKYKPPVLVGGEYVPTKSVR